MGPHIIENCIIKIIRLMEGVWCDISRMVTEITYYLTCVCESLPYTNSIHIFINSFLPNCVSETYELAELTLLVFLHK